MQFKHADHCKREIRAREMLANGNVLCNQCGNIINKLSSDDVDNIIVILKENGFQKEAANLGTFNSKLIRFENAKTT